MHPDLWSTSTHIPFPNLGQIPRFKTNPFPLGFIGRRNEKDKWLERVSGEWSIVGCNMGDKYGPMVVAKQPLRASDLPAARIAVPGTLTTAFLALRLLLPKGFSHEVMPFDHILEAVAGGRFDAGLIIHEGQLTFQNQGLHLVVDLGVWWQERTGLPLPLGGNVVRKDLGAPTMKEISRLIRESIRYGLAHRREALEHALKYARDMDVSLADKFVGMYVNDWTLDYGPRGREAVRRLLEEAHRAGVIPLPVTVEFVE